MVKAYPKYKDSGTPWIGQVPDTWELVRGKALFRNPKELNTDYRNKNVLSLTLRGVVNNNPDNPEGLVPKDYATYQIFRKNDLVFKLIDLENLRTSRVGLVHEDGIMSPAYVRLVPQKYINVKFFFYQFYDLYLRGIYNQLGAGVRATLTPSDLLNLKLAIASSEEQEQIVRYLDTQEQIIRRYIREKQKIIKLLSEQKQAIINKAVTRGIDPRVRLKPSGVEWLGDIPEHWEIVPLRWVITIGSGDFLDAQDVQEKCNGESIYPVIGGNGLIGYSYKANSHSKTIVIGRVGALCGNIHLIEKDAWITDNALRIHLIKGFTHEYLAEELRALNLNRLANANAQPLITGGMIKAQRVVRPPQDEQLLILRYVSKATVSLTKAIDSAQNEIDLIKEYHIRLISDVVTGKVDVRDIKLQEVEDISEPESIEEQEILEDVEDTQEVVNADE